jgi:hypothetical protein
MMELEDVAADIAESIVRVDSSREPFRAFLPGVGPYGEPQLVRLIVRYLNEIPKYHAACTKRTPDLLIPHEWAIEVKIARPFGDNGKEAEDWSVNLLHPYPGNISTIGDCYKLAALSCSERKAIVVIGYEHNTAKIDLTPLITAFEIVATQVGRFRLSSRIECRRSGLIHPVHECVRVFAWELVGKTDG